MKSVRFDKDFTITPIQRFLAKLSIGPVALALLVAATAFAFYLLIAFAFDVPIYDARENLRFPITPQAWTALVYSLLMGYGFVVLPVTLALNAEDIKALVDLAPRATEQNLHRICVRAFRERTRPARFWGAIAGTLGLTPLFLSMFALTNESRYSGMDGFAWFIVFVPVIFFQLGSYGYASTRNLRTLIDRVTETIEIDLLDLDSLRPFGRIAIRNAISWIIPANIFLLLFVNIPAADLTMVRWVVAANLLTGLSAMLIPLVGIHKEIRQCKQRMLEEINTCIHAVWRYHEQKELNANDVAHVANLFEIRRTLLHTREWPMDASVLSQLGFYLFIVLGGWVGGALVERMNRCSLVGCGDANNSVQIAIESHGPRRTSAGPTSLEHTHIGIAPISRHGDDLAIVIKLHNVQGFYHHAVGPLRIGKHRARAPGAAGPHVTFKRHFFYRFGGTRIEIANRRVTAQRLGANRVLDDRVFGVDTDYRVDIPAAHRINVLLHYIGYMLVCELCHCFVLIE